MRANNISVSQLNDQEVVLTYVDNRGKERKQHVRLSGLATETQPEAKAAGKSPTFAEQVGENDRVGDAMSATTTRTVAGLDQNLDSRRRGAASDRVKQALYLGTIPNTDDINRLGFNSAKEAEAAMTVDGLTPAGKLRQVRDRNLAASGSTLDETTGIVSGRQKSDPLASAAPNVASPTKAAALAIEEGKVLSIDQKIDDLKERITSVMDPGKRSEMEQQIAALKQQKQSRMVSGFTWDGLTSA